MSLPSTSRPVQIRSTFETIIKHTERHVFTMCLQRRSQWLLLIVFTNNELTAAYGASTRVKKETYSSASPRYMKSTYTGIRSIPRTMQGL